MSDMWEKDSLEQEIPAAPAEEIPAEPVDEVTVAPVEETPAVTEEPVAPAAPAAPVAPPAPPVNAYSPDSGYRYAPQQPMPPSYSVAPPSYSAAPGGYYPPQQPMPPQPPRKKNRGWLVAIAILAALAIIFCMIMGGLGIVGLVAMNNPTEDTSVTTSTTVNSTNKQPSVNDDAPELNIQGGTNSPSVEVGDGEEFYYADGGLSTEEIVNRNYDCTVVLTMYNKTSNFFFGESNLEEVGAASGIVWTKDGYIITNRHCVIDEDTGRKFDRVDVTTYDGIVYENAEVIGVDEATDLAVIRVDADNLTPATFGNSDELAVGARVVALGNAAGLSWTATQGIVSAKARDVYDDTGYAIKCLQVDVAINSGNSGGPLLNKYGQVVAINSAKIFAAGYEGLGFSIPINEAKVVIDSLAKYGYVQGRVALGITGQTVDNGYYQGFMIASIVEGSSLDGTDAQVYDLIVAVDGVKVVDYGTLRAELAKHNVGDTITLKLLRSNQRTGEVTTHYIEVTLKEQTAE